MTAIVNGVSFEYEIAKAVDGTLDGAVVFLHGWGGDIRSFATEYKTIADLGFGAINMAFPKRVPSDWGIYDYAALVRDFLAEFNVVRPTVVGHSFGGRVALILASQGFCGKIALVDSAGLKPRYSLRRQLRVAAYKRRVKCGKSLDGFGSTDYNNVDADMRGVFVRVVNTHLDRLLQDVRCKTLIFWGKNDRDTPIYMAKRLHKRIVDSEIVVVDGGHFSYVDARFAFLCRLKNFLME